jgi:hypothetical protein
MHDLTFTPLESQVLEWLLSGEDPVLALLRDQFATSRVQSRDFTGVGVYLNIELPTTNKRIQEVLEVKQDFCFGDVGAYLEADDRIQEVGFLLWVHNGYLDSLEAYTYGLEKWPEEVNSFRLFYLGDKRDLDDLRRNWEL